MKNRGSSYFTPTNARNASPVWLLVAIGVYFANVLASTWRWRLLLDAQHIRVPPRTLLSSYLVAGFFNNFLPSNIGGDVIRIRDTARPAGSKTLATTIVLADRGIGLLGLVLVAAVGATMAAAVRADGASPIWPSWLWAGFLLVTATAAPAADGEMGPGIRGLEPAHTAPLTPLRRFPASAVHVPRLPDSYAAVPNGWLGPWTREILAGCTSTRLRISCWRSLWC